MTPSAACLNARAALSEISALKQAFNTAYDAAAISKSVLDRERTHRVKELLKEKMAVLENILWPSEAERILNLREQYDFQVNLLKEMKLVESKIESDVSGNEGEILYMTGIDGVEYPVPSFSDILKYSGEKKELLRTKADQGFTELVIVPFGMDLERLMGKVASAIVLFKKQTNQLNGVSQYEPIKLPIFYVGADRNGALTYDAPLLNEHCSLGKTKLSILEEQKERALWSKGWRIILLQRENGEHLPIRRDASPHEDIEAEKSPEERVRMMQTASNDPSSPYFGEIGITPEEWAVAFASHFKKTGKHLGHMLLTGATIMIDDVAYSTTAGWKTRLNSGSQMYLEAFPIHISNIGLGTQSSVRI